MEKKGKRVWLVSASASELQPQKRKTDARLLPAVKGQESTLDRRQTINHTVPG